MRRVPRAGVDDEPPQVQLQYEDAFQYQNIFGPLVKLEADYDRRMKEAQAQHNVSVRWHMGLNMKYVANLKLSGTDHTELRLVIGDELRLRVSTAVGEAWIGVGTVLRLDDAEVSVEMRSNHKVPVHVTDGFTLEFVWKSTSFDRMQEALKSLAVDDSCISAYVYHRLMGHEVRGVHAAAARWPCRPS